jgi:hypothetical protein
MTIMAGGSKKRNPLCPLQPNELLNRGNKKTRQSQRLKEASTEEGRARITDENDDGRRATLLAGKPPPEKTKQNPGRPLGRSIQKGNTSALKSPRPTSRSKSQPTPTKIEKHKRDLSNQLKADVTTSTEKMETRVDSIDIKVADVESDIQGFKLDVDNLEAFQTEVTPKIDQTITRPASSATSHDVRNDFPRFCSGYMGTSTTLQKTVPPKNTTNKTVSTGLIQLCNFRRI